MMVSEIYAHVDLFGVLPGKKMSQSAISFPGHPMLHLLGHIFLLSMWNVI